ncbi:LysR substrate-binding domain-containing protein [Citreimonas sp.]|uniref:LysR substrate-binding domain-containing protein n=1 Tax=Citreimonas sp. TaxID=3036715 RepID=UPI0040585682
MIIPNGLKLRHVEAFLAVADLGGLTAAARARHVSQPALSKTIADLESLVGAKLFDRTGRRVVLNAEGRAFRRHALQALASLEAGIRSLGGAGPDDRIAVGVLPTVAGSLFPQVAIDFARARPDVQVAVTTGPNRYLIDRLRAGEIDLMIGRMPAADDMPGLRFEYLYEDRIDLVARADHPMAGRPAPQALRACPVILPDRSAIIRETVEKYLGVIGLAGLRPAFETVSLAFARPLLQRSDMLWFISRGVVAHEVAAGGLHAFALDSGFMTGAVGITARHSGYQNPQIAALAGLLHDAVAARA